MHLLEEGVAAHAWLTARRADRASTEAFGDGADDGGVAAGAPFKRPAALSHEGSFVKRGGAERDGSFVKHGAEGEGGGEGGEGGGGTASEASEEEVAEVERRVAIAAAQKEVAGAIWSMANENADNEADFATAGAIEPLIEMLRGAPGGYRDAAGALWALAEDETNQMRIANTDGIGPLVAILQVTPAPPPCSCLQLPHPLLTPSAPDPHRS